ncbi:hypothetical protein D3C71_1023580 [compost metagenome]
MGGGRSVGQVGRPAAPRRKRVPGHQHKLGLYRPCQVVGQGQANVPKPSSDQVHPALAQCTHGPLRAARGVIMPAPALCTTQGDFLLAVRAMRGSFPDKPGSQGVRLKWRGVVRRGDVDLEAANAGFLRNHLCQAAYRGLGRHQCFVSCDSPRTLGHDGQLNCAR